MMVRTQVYLIVVLILSVFLAGDEAAAIEPTGPVRKVVGEFAFTEGPANDPQGNLYFTDIPNNRILKLDKAEELSVFIEPSNHANGLMVDRLGRLLACEMDGQLAAIDLESKERTVLTAKHQGKRYNAPNDLVVDKSLGIYFTDPRFRAPEPWPQGKEAVYFLPADGEPRRLIDNLAAPNGVILSTDEQTLYVIPSRSSKMMAYDVKKPGVLGQGRVFCKLKQPEGKEDTGGDGLTIDTQGNLYITSALGIQIFDSEGQAVGLVPVPEQPANVTFGGKENKTMYITARTSLYAAPMPIAGHVFRGGSEEAGK